MIKVTLQYSKGNDGLVNKLYRDNWLPIWRKMYFAPHLTWYEKKYLQKDSTSKCENKKIEILEKIMKVVFMT